MTDRGGAVAETDRKGPEGAGLSVRRIRTGTADGVVAAAGVGAAGVLCQVNGGT
jgi:hypothetical protein